MRTTCTVASFFIQRMATASRQKVKAKFQDHISPLFMTNEVQFDMTNQRENIICFAGSKWRQPHCHHGFPYVARPKDSWGRGHASVATGPRTMVLPRGNVRACIQTNIPNAMTPRLWSGTRCAMRSSRPGRPRILLPARRASTTRELQRPC